MKPTNPTDCELNQVLARVIGLKHEILKDGTVMRMDAGHEWDTWNAAHNPIEMERVEEWLRENGWEYISGWSRQGSSHWAELRNSKKAFWSSDINKKRAFALAVYAWWNEQNKEKAICTDNVK